MHKFQIPPLFHTFFTLLVISAFFTLLSVEAAAADAADAAPENTFIPEVDLSGRKEIFTESTVAPDSETAEKEDSSKWKNLLPETSFCDAPTVISSPNGRETAALFCTTDPQKGLQIAFSNDSGTAWSQPISAPASLQGRTPEAVYLNDGRTAVSLNSNQEWFLWIGNYHDLKQKTDGIYRIRLGKLPDAPDLRFTLQVAENGTINASWTSRSISKTRTVRISQDLISSCDWNAMQKVHFDVPEVVEGCEPTQTPPPKGAVVLFDGSSLDAFDGVQNWTLGDGWMQAGRGSATTKQKFGSCHIHVEFATPAEVKGKGQGRGNSGIYIMCRYELQVMDSYENETYPQGQCGAIYTQNPPLKNVCRKPGEWQSYDIDFTAPKFAEDGTLLSPARMTAYQNGVLIQDDFELIGRNYFMHRYYAHEAKEPLQLQDHGCAVRYRNIWILPKE